MKSYAIILLALCCVAISNGQTDSTVSSRGHLTIHSEPPGADVFIDSSYVGRTPLKTFEVEQGSHVVKIFYPSVFSWNALTKAETLHITPKTTLEKAVALGNVLRVVTNPFGGTVSFQGTEIGLTPLYFKSTSRQAGELTIQKEGFETQTVKLTGREQMPIVLQLQSKELREPSFADVLPPDYELGNSNRLLTYTSASAMVASGVLSAYFKDRANRDFDIYLSTKDPGALSSTRRLDRYAAISLAVTQLSFVVLTYLLLSE